MTVDIQVQNARVTITVGCQSSANAGSGKVASQAFVENPADGGRGGAGETEDTGSGGGGPGTCGLVIGPIVIDSSPIPSTSGASQTSAGGIGGDGSTEDPGTGGGESGSGVLVIGPIVIAQSARSAATKVLSKPFDANP